MTASLALPLSFAALTAVGWSIHDLLLRRGPRPAVAERLAVGWLLGFSANAWLVHLSLALFGRTVPWLWLALLLPPAAALWRRAPHPAAPPLPRRGRLPPWALVPLAVLAWEILYVLAAAPSSPLAYDGLFIWALKAKALRLDATSQPGTLLPYLTGEGWAVSHPEYPLGLPALEAWIWTWLGRIDEQALKAVGPVFLLSLLALLWSHLRRTLSAGTALLLLALLSSVPGVVNVATTGYADLPLATLAGAAALHAVEALRARDARSGTLSVAFAATMLLVKREGWILFAAFAGAAALALLLSGEARRAGRFLAKSLVALAAVAGPWLLFCLRHGLGGRDFLPLEWSTLARNADRVPALAVFLLTYLLMPALFGYIWYAIPAVAALRFRRLRSPEVAFLGLLGAASLAADALIFVFSGLQPYTAHVASALDRLILHLVPLAVLFLGELLAEPPRSGV